MPAVGDIFARTGLNFGGAFTADQGIITTDGGLSGILMQNLSLNYSQAISRLYELGISGAAPNVYYVGGRSSGQMQVAHILGPAVSLLQFFQDFSNVCNAQTNTIEVSLGPSGCAAGSSTIQNGVIFQAYYCVLQSVGMNVSSNDLIINEGSSLMFSNLSYTEPFTG